MEIKSRKLTSKPALFTSNLSVIDTSAKPLLVSSATFSHDRSHVTISDYGNSIGVVDVATGKVFIILHHSAELVSDGYITCLAFSRDGTWLLVGATDGTVKLWQWETGKLLQSFKAHSKDVKSVRISLDRTRLLTGGDDGAMKLWGSETGQMMRTFTHGRRTERFESIESNFGVQAVSFSSDEVQVISAGYGGGKIWNSSSGELVREIPLNESAASMSIALLRDQERIVFGTQFGRLMLRDMNTSEALHGVRPLLTGGHYVTYGGDGATCFRAEAPTESSIDGMSPQAAC